jgi:hypothetical protein
MTTDHTSTFETAVAQTIDALPDINGAATRKKEMIAHFVRQACQMRDGTEIGEQRYHDFLKHCADHIFNEPTEEQVSTFVTELEAQMELCGCEV